MQVLGWNTAAGWLGGDQTRHTPMTPLESPLTRVSSDPAARVRTGWLWQYRAGAAVLRRPAPQTPVRHRRINYRAVDATCQCQLLVGIRKHHPHPSWPKLVQVTTTRPVETTERKL